MARYGNMTTYGASQVFFYLSCTRNLIFVRSVIYCSALRQPVFPRYLVESLRISYFEWSPALFMRFNMVFQGECCYDHVIHVTHHKVTIFLRHKSHHLKSGRGFAKLPGLLFSLSFFRMPVSHQVSVYSR